MIVRRLLAGAALFALAFSGPPLSGAAAAAPPPHQAPAAAAPTLALPRDNGARVFARADGLDAGAPTAGAPPAVLAQSSPRPAAAARPSARNSSPRPAAVQTAPPRPTAAQLAAARAEFDAFAAGARDSSHYSEYANTQLAPDLVKQVGGVLASLGTVKSFVPLPTESYGGMPVYQFVATCAKGSIDELISWDRSGKIQLIYFRAPR